MSWITFVRFAVIGISVILFFYVSQLHQYITLASVQQNQAVLRAAVEDNYWNAAFIYMAINALVVLACLPATIPLALVGGFLFGTVSGASYAALGATAGSVVAFIVVRYLVRRRVAKRYQPMVTRVNEKLAYSGVGYLLVMYYSGLIPFCVVNFVAALTNISLLRFIVVSLVGSLPLFLVCAFAGKELGSVNSVYEIFSGRVILLLVGLACIAYYSSSLFRVDSNVCDEK